MTITSPKPNSTQPHKGWFSDQIGSVSNGSLITAAAVLILSGLAVWYRSSSQTSKMATFSDLQTPKIPTFSGAELNSYRRRMEERIMEVMRDPENDAIFANSPLRFNSAVPNEQPRDRRISLILHLYNQKRALLRNFLSFNAPVEVSRDTREGLWADQKILRLANYCQDLGNMVSYLTLEDLYARVQTRELPDLHTALVSPQGYAFQTYFIGFIEYSQMRGRGVFYSQRLSFTRFNGVCGVPYSESDRRFFQKGTTEADCLEAYNDLVKYVSTLFGDNLPALRMADQRFVNWLSLDVEGRPFKVFPDTTPT